MSADVLIDCDLLNYS